MARPCRPNPNPSHSSQAMRAICEKLGSKQYVAQLAKCSVPFIDKIIRDDATIPPAMVKRLLKSQKVLPAEILPAVEADLCAKYRAKVA